MRAPGEVRKNQLVEIQYGQRLTTSLEQTLTLREVTNWVKLEGRMYQAATQVNVLSPEIILNVEADGFHFYRRQQRRNANGEEAASLPGSEAVA